MTRKRQLELYDQAVCWAQDQRRAGWHASIRLDGTSKPHIFWAFKA